MASLKTIPGITLLASKFLQIFQQFRFLIEVVVLDGGVVVEVQDGCQTSNFLTRVRRCSKGEVRVELNVSHDPNHISATDDIVRMHVQLPVTEVAVDDDGRVTVVVVVSSHRFQRQTKVDDEGQLRLQAIHQRHHLYAVRKTVAFH